MAETNFIEVKFKGTLFNDPDKLIEEHGLQPGGRVQMAIDNATVRFLHDYWAMDTGTLADSVYGQGTGTLTYFQPYARYMWIGEVWGPNYPAAFDAEGYVIAWHTSFERRMKRNFGDLYRQDPVAFKSVPGYRRDKNPKAGSFPLQRMKADHLKDIIEEAKRVARDK